MSGFVLGKFMPLHAGHQYLIDVARQRVGDQNLTVMIGSQPEEPIDGALRAAWLRELYPNVRVVHLHEPMPQLPEDHPEFWELWIKAIRKFVPTGPDLVFSSEQYGFELARRLGAVHVLVDAARSRVPISGTKVRQDPYRYWEFLPTCVRAYFARRIVLYGAESTGKTNLAERLAKHFQTNWVPEFARGYLDAKDCQNPLAAFELADVPLIAKGQIESEDRLAKECNRVIFCDTDLLTTCVYSELFFRTCPPQVVNLAMTRKYEGYLWLQTDTPQVTDLQRAPRHREPEVLARFEELLLQKGVVFTKISGDWDERFEAARRVTEQLIAHTKAVIPRILQSMGLPTAPPQ